MLFLEMSLNEIKLCFEIEDMKESFGKRGPISLSEMNLAIYNYHYWGQIIHCVGFARGQDLKLALYQHKNEIRLDSFAFKAFNNYCLPPDARRKHKL